MGHAQEAAPLNRQAYLEWEAAQPDKHEYIAGEVFAMVGVRRGHALAALTIASRLREHLKGSRCDTFVSDMKLFVADADAYFYPDVMVTCDERDRRAELAIEHPKLVVEVLSDSTAAFDRGNKFAAYRKLESLQEYVLVDLAARRIELFRRNAEGRWVLYEYNAGDTIEFASLSLRVPVALILEDTEEEMEKPGSDPV